MENIIKKIAFAFYKDKYFLPWLFPNVFSLCLYRLVKAKTVRRLWVWLPTQASVINPQ